MRFWDNCSTFASEMDIVNLIKSSGARNFAKLLSANVLAQVIGLIVYPILTRIYSPEDFGLLNLFLSIGGVLLILSTAEYYNAIVLPKEDKEAVGVVHLSLLLLLATVVLTGISVLFSDSIAKIFDTPDLAKYYWLMPIMVFVLGAWNILNYWYIRREQYNRISGYQLSQSVLSASSKIGLGYVGLLRCGMIISAVLAPLVSLLVSIGISFSREKQLLLQFSKANICRMANIYRNFPIYSLPRSMVNMVAGQLPVLLLTPIFGSKEVGFWSMALMLGFVPISVITKSLYQVLYQQITTLVNDNQLIGSVLRRFTIGVLIVGAPVAVGLYFVLPVLTEWFLGSGWETTGQYIRWMLPWLLCVFLAASTSFLSDVFFKQKIGLYFELLIALMRTVGVCIGVWLHDFSFSVAGYAIGSAVAVMAQYVWLMSLVRKHDRKILSQ